MRIVEHPLVGADKLLRIETEGCAVHIVIGLHDGDGRQFTSVEVEPLQPADNSDIWHVRGPATMVVVNHGPQLLAGDSYIGNGAGAATGHGPRATVGRSSPSSSR